MNTQIDKFKANFVQKSYSTIKIKCTIWVGRSSTISGFLSFRKTHFFFNLFPNGLLWSQILKWLHPIHSLQCSVETSRPFSFVNLTQAFKLNALFKRIGFPLLHDLKFTLRLNRLKSYRWLTTDNRQWTEYVVSSRTHSVNRTCLSRFHVWEDLVFLERFYGFEELGRSNRFFFGLMRVLAFCFHIYI